MIRTHKARDGTKSYGVRLHRGGGRYEWLGTFPTLREAKRAEAEARLRPARSQLTVAEVSKQFLSEYERTRRASTVDLARSAMKAFGELHGGALLDKISVEDAERFTEAKGWAVPVLKLFFNYAIRHDYVQRSPFRDVRRKLSRGRKDLDPLTPEEVEKLATIAQELHGWYGPIIGNMVRFAAYSGLRPGELYGLEWRDLDFPERRIRVHRAVVKHGLDLPKGGKPRLAFMTPEAYDALLALPRWSEIVFPNKSMKHLTGASMSSSYWPRVQGAFGRRVHLHELRHFCAHHLYVVRDLPSRVVAAQLGHSSPRLVEDLYSHWQKDALDELDRAFGQNVTKLRDAGGAHDAS